MTVGQIARGRLGVRHTIFFRSTAKPSKPLIEQIKLGSIACLEVINRHSMMIAPVNPVQGTAFKDAPTNYCRTARTRVAQLAAGTGSPPAQPGRRAAVGRCKARAVDRVQIWSGQPG